MNALARTVVPGVAAMATVALLSASAEAATCADLSKLALPNATIDSVQLVAAGAFTPPPPPTIGRQAAPNPAAAKVYQSLPEFCRVALTSRPSNDSDIKIEVWLPQNGWNGKFQGVGNGGWAGVIGYPALANAVAAGYAAASTDTGHVGNTAAFALGHPEKVLDMGYRAIHEMTVHAKAVTNAFYGNAPKLSFFNGCSQGGRQALTSAMRYPADYSGIIAGAPAIYYMQMHPARMAINAIANRTPDARIPREKYAAIHEAVLNKCDTLDGAKDGVLENPTQCRFDPKTIQCKDGDGPSCLTAPQVETMRQLYAPMKTPSGTIPPLLQPGTELGWAAIAGPEPIITALEPMKYIVHKDPSWTLSRLNPETDFDLATKADVNNAMGLTDPNLKPFFDRGGKLIVWHGWQDQQVPVHGSIRYYNEVVKTLGPGVVGKSFQLYMMPGVNHCQGGPGADTFDKMAAIESFVATGQAPTDIVASHSTNGKVDRTRPLCPYGQLAKWKGTGSIDDAANFSCVAQASPTQSR